MTKNNKSTPLEGGTYEIIRSRLSAQAGDLSARLAKLNAARKEVFGSIETRLIANDRISTANYCTAQDMASVGSYCIFGYNVHIGLRSGIQLADVFSVYKFQENSFREAGLALLKNEKFQTDFHNLYRYYKEAYFARFAKIGGYLYMVFHIGKDGRDFKAFKWLIKDGGLQYVDNRSDHEVVFPDQHEFVWQRADRDLHRNGQHPHVSIMDRVFVETVGGDLTIKVEDNTDDGLGIYREDVEHKDQSLDDAEYLYADLGNLIVLKIRPYQEDFRYFVFNEKMQQVRRIDSLAHSGVLLPDQQGLIFANGYYLQTGEHKIFSPAADGLLFKKRIASPNGEDFLFIFYNEKNGVYVLLQYNLISQKVNTPITCHGYANFPQGELCYFRAEDEPTKHHVVQIWQTPFVKGEVLPSEHTGSYLFKIGNKDIVKAMAECQEVLTLCNKEDSYAGLYDDLTKKCTDILDAYYWVDKKEAFLLNEPLLQVRQTATTAIDEFEKKRRIERNTAEETGRVKARAAELFKSIKHGTFDAVDIFVKNLSELRTLRGEIISLKDLRYSEPDLIENLETQCAEQSERLSADCVRFLLDDKALHPYFIKITACEEGLGKIKTAKQGQELEAETAQIGSDLELLIGIVSNLKIEDATHTTRIIDNIGGLFAKLNQVKAALKKQQKKLMGQEAQAEFNAQMKLLDQGIINYLDIAGSPEKCDEYLTKLMVQLEELESKFAEFDEFTGLLTEKREEVFGAFDTRKTSLLETRNNRTNALQNAAERILNGIQNRVKAIKELNEINGFFAADLMVDKVRDLIQQLKELDDSNKANNIQTQLKTLQEEAVRQLKDRQDLFVDGQNIIRLGRHQFSVNVQPLDLTVVRDNGSMNFHLTGTDFFDEITDPAFLATKDLWEQPLVSENGQVYRAEYLAYDLFRSAKKEQLELAPEDLLAFVQQAAATRYQEGYVKGIHDVDAANILAALVEVSGKIDLLCFPPDVRACGAVFWKKFISEEAKPLLASQLKSAGHILQVFPASQEYGFLVEKLREEVAAFLEDSGLFPQVGAGQVARYLFQELTRGDTFIISQNAAATYTSFLDFLKKKKAKKRFGDSVAALREMGAEQFQLIRKWVGEFERIERNESLRERTCLDEVAALLLLDDFHPSRIVQAETTLSVDKTHGSHPAVEAGSYRSDYNGFMQKMERFSGEVVPRYRAYLGLKKDLISGLRKRLRLEEFKPRVLSSFVRNKLIDQVYLPIFGDNLAKQIGTAGADTRTDRMGLLLLLSPPGYGKTTLMEYIADRLGLVFMKINGPALGHQTTSLDPADAPNSAARQELKKLNLALEMGNNVMLYVDDIQHCHAEFLQKFISLCDAQRKIEGVYKGEAKTYDLRGKRICVVMAGNPYTESGEKFQVPDMLANRADIYNLGDIIGDTEEVFKLSYIENAATSNPVLQKLVAKHPDDLHILLKMAQNGQKEGLDFAGNHAPSAIAEYLKTLTMLLHVRDVVLAVNQAYIRSAAMSDDYRMEPPFKLQGSYRNMNKLAEKVLPVMNQKELDTLLLSHYEGECQTLTSGAEANFLKLKELLCILSPEEKTRWEEIKKTFVKNKVWRKGEEGDPINRMVAQMGAFVEGLEGIREVLKGRNE
ncbi:MAG TPA: AAA family ATPase [Bacteroidetes bacterium]|nr:AAA family ATPase [Bacteroidota bacterium]